MRILKFEVVGTKPILEILYDIKPNFARGRLTGDIQSLIGHFGRERPNFEVLQTYATTISLQIGKNIFCCLIAQTANDEDQIQFVIPILEENLRIDITKHKESSNHFTIDVVYSNEAWDEIGSLAISLYNNLWECKKICIDNYLEMISIAQLAAVCMAHNAGYRRIANVMLDIAFNEEMESQG